MTEKSLPERTFDRLIFDMDEMIANIGNEAWWVQYYGGQEQYDSFMALCVQAGEAQERHQAEVQTPEEIAEWARQGAAFICGGPGDDVEQWGRDIAAAANEETLRQEKNALDPTK